MQKSIEEVKRYPNLLRMSLLDLFILCKFKLHCKQCISFGVFLNFTFKIFNVTLKCLKKDLQFLKGFRKTYKIFASRFYTADIYLFKFNNRNTRKSCKICSKLTIKTPEQRQWCRSCVFIVNFEHTLHLFLVFLLLTLSR